MVANGSYDAEAPLPAVCRECTTESAQTNRPKYKTDKLTFIPSSSVI